MTEAGKRRGRPITGSPKRGADGRFTIRVPIPGTNRTRPVRLGPEIQTSERASEVARHWHERLLQDPTLLGGAKQAAACTNEEYLDRFTRERAGRVRSAHGASVAIKKHVFDDRALATKTAAATTPDDLRRVVGRLNAKATSNVIDQSTARRIWAQARCMFRAMFDHDQDELRIRKDDPTAGVRPPRHGTNRKKPVLYPSEAEALLSHPEVPLRARRLWALLLYTGMRVGELLALDWSSIDLKHRRISVHESLDRESEDDTKETKTGEARDIDIVPALVPLLEAMHRESGGKGRVTWGYVSGSIMLRKHLATAGVSREALFALDSLRRQIRVQDLRASCATWLGLAEQLPDGGLANVGCRVSGKYVRDFLGHAEYETTERYYERGAGLRLEHVGIPFPPLPPTLLVDESRAISAENTCDVWAIPPQVRRLAVELAVSARTRSTRCRGPGTRGRSDRRRG